MSKLQKHLHLFLLSLLGMLSSYTPLSYGLKTHGKPAEVTLEDFITVSNEKDRHDVLKADSPELLKDRKLKEFWENGYIKVWYGNELIEKAEVVLLGEDYDSDDSFKSTAAIIHDLYQEGDIVLTEGIEYLTLLPSESYARSDRRYRQIDKKIKIYGWDNINLSLEHKDIMYEHMRAYRQPRQFSGIIDIIRLAGAIKDYVAICAKLDDMIDQRTNLIPLALSHFLTSSHGDRSPGFLKRKPTIFVLVNGAYLTSKFLEKISKDFKYVALFTYSPQPLNPEPTLTVKSTLLTAVIISSVISLGLTTLLYKKGYLNFR